VLPAVLKMFLLIPISNLHRPPLHSSTNHRKSILSVCTVYGVPGFESGIDFGRHGLANRVFVEPISIHLHRECNCLDPLL